MKSYFLTFTYQIGSPPPTTRGKGRGMIPISLDKCDMAGLYFEFILYTLSKYVWKSV